MIYRHCKDNIGEYVLIHSNNIRISSNIRVSNMSTSILNE